VSTFEERFAEYEANSRINKGYVEDPKTGEVLDKPLDSSLRIKMALGGDTFEEKANIFFNNYPNGDFTYINNKLAYKKMPEDSFSIVDKPFLDSFGSGKEFLTDMVELTAEHPELLTSIGVTLATKNPKTILGNMALFGATGVATEAAVQAGQEVFGTSKETFSQMLQRSLVTGLIEMGGAGAGVAVQRLVNAFRGGGFFRVSDEARIAEQSAKDLGINELTVGQITNSPYLQKLAGQSASTSGVIVDVIQDQQRALNRIMSQINPTNYDDLVKKLAALEQKQFSEALNQLGKRNFVSETGAGKEVSKAISQWEQLSQYKVSAAYNNANKILTEKGQNIIFDSTSVFNTAKSLKKGIQALDVTGAVQNVKPLQAELLDVVNQITKLPPESMTYEVLNAFRQRVYDLKQIPTGQVGIRQEQKQAMELYNALTKTIQNPTNSDSGFIKAWNKANSLASKRFNQLDQIAVINAAGTETPALLAKRLFSLSEPTTINILKKMFYPGMRRGRGPGSADWAKVQDAFIAEFLSNSKNLDMIGGTSTQSIKAILGPRANSFIKAVNDIYKIQKNGLNMMNNEELAKPFIDNLLSSGGKNLNQVKKLIGSMDTEAGKQLRAGIIDNIIRRSTTELNNVQTISSSTYKNIIKDYTDKGILDLLTAAERKILQDVDNVVGFIGSQSDVGTSIVGGEVVKGSSEFKSSAIIALLKNVGIGKLLTSKTGKYLLTGYRNIPDNKFVTLAFTELGIVASDSVKQMRASENN
tara:strand:+ start:1568 stop:3838 length:2271 start_codon:yes stop_codon:yes gene_type:complete